MRFRRYQNILQNRAANEFDADPNIIRNHAGAIFLGNCRKKYKDTKWSAVREDKTQNYTKNKLQLFVFSVYPVCTYRVGLYVNVGKTCRDVCVNSL
jgi:hypothetical protein